MENRYTFKIKTRYFPEHLTPEAIKLLGSTKSKITTDKNCENVSHLEITEVLSDHCSTANKNYHQDSRILYKFIPNKSFGQILDISPKYFVFKITFNSEFSYIEIWFTDQNSKSLELEAKINITFVIK